MNSGIYLLNYKTNKMQKTKKPITGNIRTARAIKFRISQLNNILEYRNGEKERIIIAQVKILEWVLNKR